MGKDLAIYLENVGWIGSKRSMKIWLNSLGKIIIEDRIDRE